MCPLSMISESLLRHCKQSRSVLRFDRGAYICKSRECLDKAMKQRQLERALETKIETAVFEQLMEEIDAN